MRTLMLSLVTGFFAFIGFIFSPGVAVPGAAVYIEQEGVPDPVAFQQTGDNGKVSFSYLPGGVYRIRVDLPQQSGKLIRAKERINCNLLVGYHNSKKQYYINEPEGFFTIKYSKIKRISEKNITPIFISDSDGKTYIGKFRVSGNNGSFDVEVRAQKPAKFQKMVTKVINDVEMITIKSR